MSSFASRAASLALDSLPAGAEGLVEAAPGSWRFQLPSVSFCSSLVVDVRLVPDWLSFSATPGEVAMAIPPGPESALEILRWNARLPGGARFAARSGSSGLLLRADVPAMDGLLERIDLRRQVAQICAGFGEGAALFHRSSPCPAPAGAPSRDGAPGSLPAIVKDSLTLAGWTLHERGPNRLAVDLDLPGVFHQALVEPLAGGIHVQAPLLDFERLPGACVAALGSFLVSGCHVLRMARVAAVDVHKRTSLRIEAAVPDLANPLEISVALESVAAGCRVVLEEAKALQDEDIARAFLAARPGDWDPFVNRSPVGSVGCLGSVVSVGAEGPVSGPER